MISLPRVNGTTFEDVKDSLHRYLEDVATSQPLSSKEEVSLARRIKKGDMEARAKLVEANLRFVITVAREYQNQGVPLVDLISAGNVGEIRRNEGVQIHLLRRLVDTSINPADPGRTLEGGSATIEQSGFTSPDISIHEFTTAGNVLSPGRRGNCGGVRNIRRAGSGYAHKRTTNPLPRCYLW